MAFPILSITPTQRSVRFYQQVEQMEDYARSGGTFDRQSLDDFAQMYGVTPAPLIQIDVFEDSRAFCRDGQHRIIGIWLSGEKHLLNCEYEISRRTYRQYAEVNLNAGWVTPFDPREEIRKEELSHWKHLVAKVRAESSDKEAVDFIFANKSMYAEPRGHIRTVQDLIETVKK